MSQSVQSLAARDLTSPERVIIDLLFHYTVLCEYQLLSLESDVRGFVERMSGATTSIDARITKQSHRLRAQAASLRGRAAAGAGMTAAELETLAAEIESVAASTDEAQPDIYTIVECLSFEDIQSQRLDHLVKSSNRLNTGIMERLHAGLENESVESTRAFASQLARSTRSLYTMPVERDVFDQVFISFFDRSSL